MRFEDICEENYAKIYNYILAKTKNEWVAQDITQEVFLIACRSGRKFLHHEKPLAFLYLTAKNLVLEYFRQQERVKPCEDIEKESAGDDIFWQISSRRAQMIDENYYQEYVMQKLAEPERNLYKEYYINKKTMREIALEMKISETAVRMRFVRIRRKIKAIVSGLRLDEF